MTTTMTTTKDRIAAKRASEQALQKLLREAQNTFSRITESNKKIADSTEDKEQQQEQKRHAESSLTNLTKRSPSVATSTDASTDTSQDASFDQFSSSFNGSKELEFYSNDDFDDSDDSDDNDTNAENFRVTRRQHRKQLNQRGDSSSRLTSELKRAKNVFPTLAKDYERMETEFDNMWNESRVQAEKDASRIKQLEMELEVSRTNCLVRKQSELVLKKSLNEAMDLVRPLKDCLEMAEKEKKILAKKLKAAKRHIEELEGTHQPVGEIIEVSYGGESH
mmetsp:Transcript_11936/g.18446  ORF Transcript_11936/g.18446 Transcript_11936/m.18446 type:complete len:278 (-) Transcript_11936:135-968(-)